MMCRKAKNEAKVAVMTLGYPPQNLRFSRQREHLTVNLSISISNSTVPPAGLYLAQFVNEIECEQKAIISK